MDEGPDEDMEDAIYRGVLELVLRTILINQMRGRPTTRARKTDSKQPRHQQPRNRGKKKISVQCSCLLTFANG